MLDNTYAIELYHDFAAKMPIIDYHNHLPPHEIAEDKIFKSITEVWIDGDHYKWRAMRTLGIDEKYITGKGTDLEKFKNWAHTVPYTMRNPLYHWTHLELKRYFDIPELLSADNAERIFRETSEKLATPGYSCQNLLTKMNVEVLCTTEGPTDTLEHHRKLANTDFSTKVGTAFRPDEAFFIGLDSYNSYLDSLEEVVGKSIRTYDQLCDALVDRITFFNENGCRLSDHGLEHLYAEDFTASEIESIFIKKREGKEVSPNEVAKFQTATLLFLSEKYHAMGWVQQFHLGALRNSNSRMLGLLGPNTGWDSIGDYPQATKLSKFLDILDSRNVLAKTIIYNLNPADNEIFAAMIGNFNDGSIKGKVQFGSGWWFLDQKDGMTNQMNALSNIGLISCFIGMLTDSRSFLSYPRHEYFRRILCNLLGDDINKGILPNDIEWIGKMVQDISYNNAKEYFKF